MSKPTYYAVAKYDYVSPAAHMTGDFGKAEYARYKKLADKAEIKKDFYSPFPTFIQAEVRREALLYFKTKPKFEAFHAYLRQREEKTGEFFGIMINYKNNPEIED